MKYSFSISIIFLLANNVFGQVDLKHNLKKEAYYDSILNGAILRDYKSVEIIFKTKDNLIDKEDYRTEVINDSGEQILTMYFLPGDAVNQFSQFKVEYNSGNKKPELRIDQIEFLTGKGIKLGISQKKVKELLGPPHQVVDVDDLIIFKYQQNNGLYFGNYYFKENKLIQFWFGFSYP